MARISSGLAHPFIFLFTFLSLPSVHSKPQGNRGASSSTRSGWPLSPIDTVTFIFCMIFIALNVWLLTLTYRTMRMKNSLGRKLTINILLPAILISTTYYGLTARFLFNPTIALRFAFGGVRGLAVACIISVVLAAIQPPRLQAPSSKVQYGYGYSEDPVGRTLVSKVLSVMALAALGVMILCVIALPIFITLLAKGSVSIPGMLIVVAFFLSSGAQIVASLLVLLTAVLTRNDLAGDIYVTRTNALTMKYLGPLLMVWSIVEMALAVLTAQGQTFSNLTLVSVVAIGLASSVIFGTLLRIHRTTLELPDII